jgi:hypothetical protein
MSCIMRGVKINCWLVYAHLQFHVISQTHWRWAMGTQDMNFLAYGGQAWEYENFLEFDAFYVSPDALKQFNPLILTITYTLSI